ncbi:hypothetical protein NIES4072_65770 [Nostoc commune NIES-4072]|uniref:Uncharacterized protein n=1 Tax=Nostoc commune NIES-4072 TaxID=2005467 RepID=A0A2R5FX58_NOSCO|nr:hypothetical protein [Nostoc commune]BBD70211.1 hypothetical protein NIES4070_66220 [Nostoc commune HK-02]GBG22865.1 hypothetical protein NIES4072_65770 [Nostoc commune NIES-4072]
MANSTNSFDRRANHSLRSNSKLLIQNSKLKNKKSILHFEFCILNCFGGCVPLHRLQFQFSDSVIQTLLDKELVQVQNTGRGFLLEIAEDF